MGCGGTLLMFAWRCGLCVAFSYVCVVRGDLWCVDSG